jgi:hypothetical protein
VGVVEVCGTEYLVSMLFLLTLMVVCVITAQAVALNLTEGKKHVCEEILTICMGGFGSPPE